VGGFELLGRPERIDWLGGTDFDAAVFGHVAGVLGARLAELDEDDPAVTAAVARLREECTPSEGGAVVRRRRGDPGDAVERVHRGAADPGAVEAMIRPRLAETIEALGGR
jgi:hypothetical protein